MVVFKEGLTEVYKVGCFRLLTYDFSLPGNQLKGLGYFKK